MTKTYQCQIVNIHDIAYSATIEQISAESKTAAHAIYTQMLKDDGFTGEYRIHTIDTDREWNRRTEIINI